MSSQKKVIFVGDRPSRLNESPDVAFVGASCYPRLIQWISKLELSNYELLNSHTSQQIQKVEKYYKEGHKIIALGLAAATRLKKNSIEHFKLPHPSGLNRQINNQNYIDEVLADAYLYIRGFL